MNIDMHPEDIKAAIRKQYGTIIAFERANNLAQTAVSDFLRGKVSKRTSDAIKKILIVPANSKKTQNEHPKSRVNEGV